jgi:hypothetical protein
MAISRAGISKQLEGRRKTPPRHLEHKVTFGKQPSNRNNKRPEYKTKTRVLDLKPKKTFAQIEKSIGGKTT